MARSASLNPIVHAAAADPADALTTIATQEEADLIVVGNKGMKGARRALGSIPNDVAHRAPCSVLIVDTTG
jgi:nucleotide-binding universal stress UspA family protein